MFWTSPDVLCALLPFPSRRSGLRDEAQTIPLPTTTTQHTNTPGWPVLQIRLQVRAWRGGVIDSKTCDPSLWNSHEWFAVWELLGLMSHSGIFKESPTSLRWFSQVLQRVSQSVSSYPPSTVVLQELQRVSSKSRFDCWSVRARSLHPDYDVRRVSTTVAGYKSVTTNWRAAEVRALPTLLLVLQIKHRCAGSGSALKRRR